MQILPGTRITKNSSSSVTLQHGNRPALLVEDLTPHEVDWLLAQCGPISIVCHRGTPRSTDLTPGWAPTALFELLLEHGFLSAEKPPTPRLTNEQTSAEIAHLQGLNLDPQTILQRRARAVIVLQGLSAAVLHLAGILVTAGFRKFVVDDQGPAISPDLCVHPLYPRSASSRKEAFAEFLRHFNREARVVPGESSPHLAIISAVGTMDVVSSALLTTVSLPHLLVTSTLTDSVVGPFIIPDVTPQICCFDRSTLLPWTLPIHHDLEPGSSENPPHINGTVGLSGAGLPLGAVHATAIATLAAHAVVRYFDGFVPLRSGEQVVWSSAKALPVQRYLDIQQDCLCTIQS